MKNRKTTMLLVAAALALTLCGGAVLAAEGERVSQDIPRENLSADLVLPAAGTQEEASAETRTEQNQETAVTTPQPDPEGTLSFANLTGKVKENCLDYLILEENVRRAEAYDYEKMLNDLRDQLNDMTTYQNYMMLLGDTEAARSVAEGYEYLEMQFDAIRDGDFQKEVSDGLWQLRTAQNTILKFAQSGYAQLVELYATRATLVRALDALDRQVEEMELRYEMGQVSALNLQQLKAGRESLISKLQSLDMGLKSGLMSMEQMTGAEPNGTLQLSQLPLVTGEQLAAMDLDADLEAAKSASFDLYAAKKTLDDAEEVYDDEADLYNFNEEKFQFIQAKHTWQAAQYTYQNTIQNFELSFRGLYDQVKDYKQILDAARTTLAVEEANYQADQLKFTQGTISRNALLTAEDDLNAARDTVATAERNLFVAYNNYRWAVEHGILN